MNLAHNPDWAMLLAHVAISVFCLSGGIALLAKAYELIRRANKED